ncbi:MAG: hypothetical protein QM523_06295 [Candidatus Pacebacteria bacterium]|nr:hypothetical protein [Candidatus Paceibacterota bacterium]
MSPLSMFLLGTSALLIGFSIFLHYSDKVQAEEAAKAKRAQKIKKPR